MLKSLTNSKKSSYSISANRFKLHNQIACTTEKKTCEIILFVYLFIHLFIYLTVQEYIWDAISCMKKLWANGHPYSAHWRRWSDCEDEQSDLMIWVLARCSGPTKHIFASHVIFVHTDCTHHFIKEHQENFTSALHRFLVWNNISQSAV